VLWRAVSRGAAHGAAQGAGPGRAGQLAALHGRSRSLRGERMGGMKFARRMSEIGTETAFEVLAKARKLEAQGRNVVHLEIGEPDFPTPPNIVEAAERALRDGFTHYTPAGGLLPARQAVADWIRRWYEVEVKPEQVVMVPGSKNVLLFTMLALVEQGDEVIVPD